MGLGTTPWNPRSGLGKDGEYAGGEVSSRPTRLQSVWPADQPPRVDGYIDKMPSTPFCDYALDG